MSQHGHGQNHAGFLSRALRIAIPAALVVAACGKTSLDGGPLDSDAGGGVPAFDAGGKAPSAPSVAGHATAVGGEPGVFEEPGAAGARSPDGGAPSQVGGAGHADAGGASVAGSPSADCSTFDEAWAINHCTVFGNSEASCSSLCRQHIVCTGDDCPDCSACEPDCESCRRVYIACRKDCLRTRAVCVKFECPVWQQRCAELAEQYPECVPP